MKLLRKGTSISNLRLSPAPHTDALSLRRHVERNLASLSLVPPGMNDEGILCIRNFADAAPGILGAAQPGSRQLSTWNLAAQQVLSSCLRTALRPSRGYVPPEAASVYFPNEAELLACLALSKARHTFPLEWWWKDVLGASRLTLPWSVFWIEAPTSITSAVNLLAKDQQLHEVLAGASTTEIVALHRAVTHCHVVSPTLKVLAPSPDSLSPVSEYVENSKLSGVASLEGKEALEWELAWQMANDLPELSSFPPESPSFLFALTSLLVKRNPSGARRVTAKTLRLLSEIRREPLETHAEDSTPEQGLAPTKHEFPAIPATPPEGRSPEFGRVATQAPEASDAKESSQSAEPSPSAIKFLPFAEVITPARPTSHGKTKVGGVFYLINLALHFGLYSDFTQPRGFNLCLSPWDFLSEIGRRLLPEPQSADPLWDFLAALSGNLTPERRQELWQPPTAWQPPFSGNILEALRANDTNAVSWLDALAPYLASRVRSASGLASESWLRAGAGYRLTDDRLDVYYALAKHPVELRFAGLDRDPGWIPAANVSVFFHYE